MDNFKSKINTKTIVVMGMLIALEIVLSRFLSINAWNIKIGFNFVPVVIAGMLLGPVYAGLVGALGDFLGATLFPIGAYFPGFTVTAFLMGIVWGVFLYREQNLQRIVPAVAINQLILSLCLNTLWISILYGSDYKALFVTRIVQTLILICVQFVTVFALSKVMPRMKAGLEM